MPKINTTFKTKSSIITIDSLCDNSLIIQTKLHGIKIFSFKEKQIIFTLNKKIINENIQNAIFTSDAKIFAFSNQTTIYIISLLENKIIKKIELKNKIISTLTFSDNQDYIFVGTKDGRVFQFNYENQTPLARVCSFSHEKIRKSAIYKIATSKTHIASTNGTGEIIVQDIYSLSYKTIFRENIVKVKVLFFLDEHKLISGNIDGSIYIFNLLKSSSIKITLPFLNIKDIVSFENDDFILVNTDHNFLTLIDIKNAKIIDLKYLKFKNKITNLVKLPNQNLVVVLENHKIIEIELVSQKLLYSLVEKDLLTKAFDLIDEAPFLKNSSAYVLLEKKYKIEIQKVVDALTNNNKQLASKILDKFKNIKAKKVEIQKIIHSFRYFDRFKILFLEKKYTLAYAMSDKYEILKSTKYYQKMEQNWNDHFRDASRQIRLAREDIAKEILSSYITINLKREVVKLTLSHTSLFLDFIDAVDDKDYPKIYLIVEKNQIFKTTFIYKNLQLELDNILNEIDFSLTKGDVTISYKKLKQIYNLVDSKEKLKYITTKLDLVKKLYDLYSKDEINSCYEIIDKHRVLDDVELSMLLQKHWRKLITRCEKLALKAELKEIKKILKDFIFIDSKNEKVGSILRVAFQVKIKQLLMIQEFRKAEKVIYSYIDIFGRDIEINEIIQELEKISDIKLAIIANENRAMKRDAWLYQSF